MKRKWFLLSLLVFVFKSGDTSLLSQVSSPKQTEDRAKWQTPEISQIPEFALSQTFDLGYWRLRVKTGHYVEKENQLIIDLSLNNKDTRTRLQPDFTLVDQSGYSFDGEFTFVPPADPWYAAVSPGGTVRAAVIFNVPPNNYWLIVHDLFPRGGTPSGFVYARIRIEKKSDTAARSKEEAKMTQAETERNSQQGDATSFVWNGKEFRIGMNYEEFSRIVPQSLYRSIAARDGIWIVFVPSGIDAQIKSGQISYSLVFSLSNRLVTIQKIIVP